MREFKGCSLLCPACIEIPRPYAEAFSGLGNAGGGVFTTLGVGVGEVMKCAPDVMHIKIDFDFHSQNHGALTSER
jgi:hypothetical protein